MVVRFLWAVAWALSWIWLAPAIAIIYLLRKIVPRDAKINSEIAKFIFGEQLELVLDFLLKRNVKSILSLIIKEDADIKSEKKIGKIVYISEMLSNQRAAASILAASVGVVLGLVAYRRGEALSAMAIFAASVIILFDWILLHWRVATGRFGTNAMEAAELISFIQSKRQGEIPPGTGGFRSSSEATTEARATSGVGVLA